MDSFSQMSVDSDDSIPRNVCEEVVVVDSTIQSIDAKDDDVAMASEESEDETYDDEIRSNSRASSASSHIDDTQANSGQSKVHASSTPLLQRSDKNPQIPTDEQKTSNLKLVLKKSPEYQLVINPSPNSPNQKIILLANMSSPTYSVTTSDGKNSTTVTSNKVDTKETPMLGEHPDEAVAGEELLKLSQDQNRPLKTYGRPKTSLSSKADDLMGDVDKIQGSNKDETDADSVKSEPDTKPSTPKITRELQQLQKTVNESKILSEYINDSGGGAKSRKTRKTGTAKGESEGSLIPPHRMRSRSRSCSKSRVDSPIDSLDKSRSWQAEDKTSKRQNMRSQNSEFVQKQMKFLSSIQGAGDDGTDNSDCETSMTDGKSSSHSESQPIASKRELLPPPKPGWDMFCFKCHMGGDLIPCSKCVRSYHMKCVKNAAMVKVGNTWNCPECVTIESSLKATQTKLKTNVFLENLTQLLLFALKRMKQSKGFENFLTDFSDDDYPDYSKYIVCPMTLEKLQTCIEEKRYKCTEEFAVDTKWILHNSSVYFGNNSKITNFAKGIVKVCRQELTEIDTCSECYYNANTRRDWFVQVCSRPHMLLWAKLKGFPYWPAKAMGIQGTLVNVRFFGDHDRAYVPIKECFLYSETDPNPTKQNKKSIKECIKEVDIHIRKIIATFGTFVYPPFRTVYDPTKELEQLETLIPGINEFMKNAEKSSKPHSLTYKIVKTAGNHLSIIKKDAEKIADIVTSNSALISNTNDLVAAVAQSADGDKVRKQRFESTDSSHSNNEVTSTCENTPPMIDNTSSAVHTESASSCVTVEAKPVEKTVAPLKIQERIDSESTQKTYEVVPNVSDTNQAKVNSVILKRKSDNWNAVSAVNSSKRQKTQTVEVGVCATNALAPTETPEPSTSSAETTTAVNATIASQQLASTYKGKRSREEVSSKVQKPKLDEIKIPPLILLTTPFVLSSSTTTLPTQSTVVSSIPIIPSIQNTGVTVTITQSPVVTSASSETLPPATSIKPTTSSAVALNSLMRFENSEISIKRLPKKTSSTQPTDVPLQAIASADKSKEKAAENTIATATQPAVCETDASQTTTASPVEVTKSNEALDANKNKEPNRVSELIPFDEIKTEKPDSDVPVVEVRSKTATPEQLPPPTNAQRRSVGAVAANCSDSFRPVLIKTEIMSDDDEDLSNQSRSEENCDSESSASNAKSGELKSAGNVASSAANASQKTNKPETKKQRARKSFPNKGNFNPVVLANQSNTSATKARPILPQPLLPQNNGMVYIPVDPKTADSGKQNFPTSSAATASATPKAVVNSISITPCLSSSSSSSTSTVTVTGFSVQNTSAPGSPMNTRVTPLAPTILTTSVQLPIVYSTLPLPGVLNGPTINPASNGGAPLQASCTVQPNSAPVPSEQHMLSGFVTPTLASAITEAIVRGPPKLAPRPSGPLRSDGDYVFPTEAGPVSKILADNAHKMADFFRSVIEDTLSDMAKNQCSEARVRLLEMDLEKVKYTHEKELAELKHNTDMMLCEMRKSLENEKARLVAETRKQCEQERIRAVEEAKTKQWCAACGKEAQFYCCWNTSYCDYPCQQKHWARHMSTCAQKDNTDANAQRVGVKISQYSPNAAEKQSKPKELVSSKPYLPMGNRPAKIAPIRKYPVSGPSTLNRVLSQRPQPAPLYTVINSNDWNIVTSPQFQRDFSTTGLIVSDAVTKSIPAKCSINMIQSPKMS